MQLHINKKLTKKDICPICQLQITAPNFWVRYHVRYDKPIVILACRYCNATEHRLRRNIPLSPSMAHRAQKVLDFHMKLLPTLFQR